MMLRFIIEGFKVTGASVMWIILIIACLIIGLLIERGWYLFIRCGMGSGSFMSGISKYLKAGDYAKAIQYASSVNTPLAKGITSILQNRGKGSKTVQKAVDEVFLTEVPKISRWLPMMSTLANLATLLGLTGTIFGLMIAFDAIANVPAAQRAQALATGISVAMATTLWGLLVAVPTIFFHGILSNRSDKVIEEMDEKTTKLINLVEE